MNSPYILFYMPRIRHNSRKKILANSLFNATANTNNNSSPHAHRSVSMPKFSMHTNWFLIAHISNKCSGNHDTFYTRYRKFVFHFTARQSSKNEKKNTTTDGVRENKQKKATEQTKQSDKSFFSTTFRLEELTCSNANNIYSRLPVDCVWCFKWHTHTRNTR